MSRATAVTPFFDMLKLALFLSYLGCLAVLAQTPLPRMVSARLGENGEWKDYSARTLATLETNVAADKGDSKYGGAPGPKEKATGWFHVKQLNGRWWLIDPDGYRFLSKGVNSVTLGNSQKNQAALRARFGTEQQWAGQTAALLTQHGFNSTGSWSRTDLLRQTKPRVPYTLMWNFMSSYGKRRGGTFQQPGHTGYPNDAIFVFDPAFETFCDEHAKQLLATRDDPYLLGHFSDNELPFRDNVLDNYLGLPESDAGYKAAVAWLNERKKSKADIHDADRTAFLEFATERYFRLVAQAMRKYDPQHLYLGARFHGRVLNYEAVLRAAGKHADVISINYYNRWSPEPERLRQWAAWAGRPILITEWYARAMDSGLPNTTGAGWTVKTQADRAAFYQNFTLGLLEAKVCVGWHWFKYLDNDPEDTTVDPSNRTSNKGLVTSRYEEYRTLLDAMRALNQRAYGLIDYFDKR